MFKGRDVIQVHVSFAIIYEKQFKFAKIAHIYTRKTL